MEMRMINSVFYRSGDDMGRASRRRTFQKALETVHYDSSTSDCLLKCLQNQSKEDDAGKIAEMLCDIYTSLSRNEKGQIRADEYQYCDGL